MKARSAAIRLSDGRIFESDNHASCAYEAGFYTEAGIADAYFDKLEAGVIVEGFVMLDGVFLTRKELNGALAEDILGT